MRLSLGLALLSVLRAVQAASTAFAQVYLFDSDTACRTLSSQVVSPETARLIFAERLGLSQFHPVEAVDDEVVQQVNRYGGRPRPLFQEQAGSKRARPRMMIIVEGVADPKDIIGHGHNPNFTILNPPRSTSNRRMLADLAAQAEYFKDPKNRSKGNSVAPGAATLIDALQLGGQSFNSRNGITFIHVPTLEHIIGDYGQTSIVYKEESSRMSKAFREILISDKVDGLDTTLVLMPPQQTKGKERPNPYGIYESSSSRSNTRREVENPLTISHGASSLDTDTNPGLPHTLANTSMPSGILPPCFASLSSCQSSTYNCSGHGSCQRKYVNKDQNDAACYTCVCKADVRTNQDGSKKTIRWGGPACQKKDVITPFWLLAGFTVAMVFVVTWAIMLLYHMGQEDLPSVIGAGVAGPRATK